MAQLVVSSRALRECHVTMSCRALTVADVLGGEDEYAPLRVHQLNVSCSDVETNDEFMRHVMPSVVSHASLTRLALRRAPLGHVATLDAVVDAALARGMTFLSFCECSVWRGSLPSLARLLHGNTTLTTLVIRGDAFLDDAAMALQGLFRDEALTREFADALRGNATLTSLTLHRVGLWRWLPTARALLEALQSHASLTALHLSGNMLHVNGHDTTVEGALVASFLAAEPPALTHLDVSACGFEHESMQPLLLAAARSTRLRSLFAMGNSAVDDAFAREAAAAFAAASCARQQQPARAAARHGHVVARARGGDAGGGAPAAAKRARGCASVMHALCWRPKLQCTGNLVPLLYAACYTSRVRRASPTPALLLFSAPCAPPWVLARRPAGGVLPQRAPPHPSARIHQPPATQPAPHFRLRARNMADGADGAAPAAAATFASLPHAVTLLIFARLPVHAKLRAAAVCRAWRTTLAERSLWMALDLSPGSGVPRRLVTDGLLLAAAARARNRGPGLESLDISDCPGLTPRGLQLVLRAHDTTLRVLRMCNARAEPWRGVPYVVAQSHVLRECHLNVRCRGLNVARVLGGEREYAPLRVHQLNVSCTDLATADAFVANVVPFLATHASLTRLALRRAPLNVVAALDAVVDAALARGMTFLSLCEGSLHPASLSSLARLLRGNTTLTTLVIRGEDAPMIRFFGNEALTQLFADALRSNTTLTSLTLHHVGLWTSFPSARALLGALTGHVSLTALHLTSNLSQENDDTTADGELIAALLSANPPPALTHLDVSDCGFEDGSMQPLLMAAARSTRLRSLYAGGNEVRDDAFMRDEMLPAVRANSSLRTLQLGEAMTPHAREAEALVAARRRRTSQ
jgi:hypothetical protein